jgi:hypothetical protein
MTPIIRTEEVFHVTEAARSLFRHGRSYSSPRMRSFQKALVSRVVHQDTAFLTGRAIRGCLGHGDFVFSSAVDYNGHIEVHNSLLSAVLRDKPQVKLDESGS